MVRLETWIVRMIHCPRLHTDADTTLCLGLCPKYKGKFGKTGHNIMIECSYGEENVDS